MTFFGWLLDELERQQKVREKEPALIQGRDLITELNLEPSGLIGRLLDAVEEARAEGAVSTRAQALELCARLVEDGAIGEESPGVVYGFPDERY